MPARTACTPDIYYARSDILLLDAVADGAICGWCLNKLGDVLTSH